MNAVLRFACILSVLSLLVAGCQPQTTTTRLPHHRLDLSAQPQPPAPQPVVAPPNHAPAVPVLGGDPHPEWAANGFRAWKYIVIHHSATDVGSAELFDTAHRNRGWDELGYHFVITNGQGGPDGSVQVGSRWRKQKWGAHCKTEGNQFNDYGIGICLVGNFSETPPSNRQLQNLQELVTYLVDHYNVPPENVIGHADAPGTSTECPGKLLHAYIHQTLKPALVRHLARR